MTKYETTTLEISDYEHFSDYFKDCVFYIDCVVDYEWINKSLNDISLVIDYVKLETKDNFIDIYPVLNDKAKKMLYDELMSVFSKNYYIDKSVECSQ